ncbi:MAG: hypothetical protein DMF49_10265 [Acidobacteria bacterium]|nr:MAG: hypothetical protein DMF49_10265 [Acidobacteriota bacterium]
MPPPPPLYRSQLLLPIAAALASSLLIASAYPLIDPDEGRNAEVAREMVVSGDLLVPHLAGMPYLDKPPGLFWGAALATRTFGFTPWAARLPAAVAAAATLWVIGLLALRCCGAPRGVYAVILLASSPLFLLLSAFVIFDMPLTFCVTVIWTMLAREMQSGASWSGRIGMYVAIAAGLLIKGPVMLAWAIGGSLGAALVTRSAITLRWLRWWPGWMLILLVVGGWFGAASWRYPEYPRYAFLEETIERTTTGSFHRQQPLWFVPAVFILGALPWSLATPWTRSLGRESRVALGFILFASLFFTLSRSDLVTYLLPAFPPLAWVAAEAWSHPSRTKRGGWGLALVYGLLALGFFLLPLVPSVHNPHAVRLMEVLDVPAARMLSVVFALASAVAMSGAVTTRRWLLLASVPVLSASICVALGPALVLHARAESGAPLAKAIAETAPDGPVRFEYCYSPGTDFLLGRCSELVSDHGHETTSNYQQRYHQTLMRRDEWRLLPSRPVMDSAAVLVRSIGSINVEPGASPAGWIEFYRDARFVAYRRNPASLRRGSP